MESIKFPVGRIVQGSVYRLNPVLDNKTGVQKTFQKGAKKGQPRFDCFFALAIPKNPGETHFAQTEWGKKLWQIGNTAHPKFAQGRDFSWKVTDGDSPEPDKKGNAPNTKEGFQGHWIVKFNNSSIPRVGKMVNGKFQDFIEPDFVKSGYFVEVVGEVEGNGADNESPGIYINHQLVCFRFYGQEISYGPNPDDFDFGTGGAAPVGASETPLATPALPSAPAPAPAAAIPPLPSAPAPAAAISPLPSAPAPKVLTAKAGGATYEAMVAQGWNDALLIEHGYMQAPVTPIPSFGTVTGV